MMNKEVGRHTGKMKKLWKELKYDWTPDFDREFWIVDNDLYYKDVNKKTGLESNKNGWVLLRKNFVKNVKIRGVKYETKS